MIALPCFLNPAPIRGLHAQVPRHHPHAPHGPDTHDRDALADGGGGASAFGGLIELIQPHFNRSADLYDWVADTLGVCLGIGAGLLYRRLRQGILHKK